MEFSVKKYDLLLEKKNERWYIDDASFWLSILVACLLG
jgi:hypothetical protein